MPPPERRCGRCRDVFGRMDVCRLQPLLSPYGKNRRQAYDGHTTSDRGDSDHQYCRMVAELLDCRNGEEEKSADAHQQNYQFLVSRIPEPIGHTNLGNNYLAASRGSMLFSFARAYCASSMSPFKSSIARKCLAAAERVSRVPLAWANRA